MNFRLYVGVRECVCVFAVQRCPQCGVCLALCALLLCWIIKARESFIVCGGCCLNE